MMNIKKIVRIITLAALLGATMYAIVYFMASHSEGFEFAEQKIRNSPAVRAQVEEVRKVHPALLGPYDQKTVDADEWVSMALHVSGSLKNITLDVKMKKTNGVWVIESSTNNGQSVALN